MLAPWVSVATGFGTQFVIGEGSSMGVKEPSEVPIASSFATALWVCDILPHMASIGIPRWNFHGAPVSMFVCVYFVGMHGMCVANAEAPHESVHVCTLVRVFRSASVFHRVLWDT